MIQTDNLSLAKEIWAEIGLASKIFLHLHVNTDGDSVGSTLAFKKALETIGKEVKIYSGENKVVPKYLNFLPGGEKVVIEPVSASTFDKYDLFIALDTASITQISRNPDFALNKEKTIVIDHHKGNTKYGKINLVDADYVATCELLVDLLEVWGVEIDADMATCLYAGVCTDSGNLIYPPTSYKTLEKMARLAKITPLAISAANKIASNTSREEFLATKICMQNMEFYFEDRIALATVTQEQLIANKCYGDDFGPSQIASMLSKVEGVVAGICLYQKDENIRVSFRAKDAGVFNVRLLAEKFPIGGGHDAAAGATYVGSLESCKEFVLAEIKTSLDQKSSSK